MESEGRRPSRAAVGGVAVRREKTGDAVCRRQSVQRGEETGKEDELVVLLR
jgi:hypothetical protein